MTEFGALMFPTDYAIRPAALAKAIEEREMDSLFFLNTHIPVSRKTPFPEGIELLKNIQIHYDPFVALASCAAVTERIKLGQGFAWL